MNANNLKENIDKNSVKFNSNGKGAIVKINDEFVTKMTDSDKPECKFKRGDRVYKATYEKGDIHEIGTVATVVGSIFEKTVGEAYLVLFEGDENMCFTIGAKLKAEK